MNTDILLRINWAQATPIAIQNLIDGGADVNAQSQKTGNYPLHLVNEPEIADVLRENGADINAKNHAQKSPLHTYTATNNHEMMTWALDNGADIESTDTYLRTPLFSARKVSTARILIDRNANIMAKDEKDEQPLHYFVFMDYEDISILLIEKNADFKTVNKENKSPMSNAKEMSNDMLYIAMLEKEVATQSQALLDILQEKAQLLEKINQLKTNNPSHYPVCITQNKPSTILIKGSHARVNGM